MQNQELTINGELFEEFRNNVDTAMKILVNRMLSTKIHKGAVSTKIGIEIKEIIDDNGEIIRMPDITYTIGMGMSEKDSMKGNLRRGMTMRRLPNGDLIVGTEQVSMDELMEGKA